METNLLYTVCLYFAIGCGEWLLATRRSSAMMDFEMRTAALVVFIESVLGYYVINRFIVEGDWWIVISASAGASLGLYIEMRRRRAAKQKERDNGQTDDCKCARCAAFEETGTGAAGGGRA